MAADYYPSDGAGPDMDMAATTPDTKPTTAKEEGETALLPKSILAGKEFKPGDEVVLKIVHMYEDEVEVAYASEKEPEGDTGMGDEDEGQSPEDTLQSMAS